MANIPSLTPPRDITWKRMAFSRDMLDTNFGDMTFPPKWRTSLTVYYYIVPEEETVDAYPESRIVYLKLSCSITGWNPSEELAQIKIAASESDQWDDLQKSIWEAVEASSWASKYWGCHGAIMQIGVFPSKVDQVDPDDYPYIIDFDPKRRELFEQVSEGSELLAGSSDHISVTKGSTNTQSLGHKSFGSYFGFVGGEVTAGATWQQIDSKTTDTSREKRETLSHTSSFSQMYQLFNGYHLGTNRAVFVVAPRPHTVDSSFNLLDGERRLEGIQDVFLVVTMPRTLKGFCIHASIDTGHKYPEEKAAASSVRKAFALRTVDFSDPPCLGGVVMPPKPPGGGGGGGGTLPPGDEDEGITFMITRRMVQACGLFNDQGQLVLQKIPAGTVKPPHVFVGEHFIPTRAVARIMAKTNTGGGAPEGGFDDCRPGAAARYNYNLSRMSNAMVSMFSSGAARPKAFNETSTFKTLFAEAAGQLDLPLKQLHRLRYVSGDEYRQLQRYRVSRLSDLFKRSAENISNINLNAIRSRIVNKGS
jgi:hypothetical protein